MNRFSGSRKGVSTLLVILMLIFVTSMLGVMLRQLQVGVKQRRLMEHKVQAGLLAESAIERAVARANVEDEYSSEVWQIPAEEFSSRYAGSVEIEVDRSSQPAKVSVVARYPSEGERSTQVRRDVFARLDEK